jgi:hypothetical protein
VDVTQRVAAGTGLVQCGLGLGCPHLKALRGDQVADRLEVVLGPVQHLLDQRLLVRQRLPQVALALVPLRDVVHDDADGDDGTQKSGTTEAAPWWQKLSFAVGAQFPVTAAREFEFALTTSLKLDF